MNPGDKGWLKRLVALRKKNFKARPDAGTLRLLASSQDAEDYLYQLVQPTGLMFGHFIRLIEDSHPTQEEWSETEKIKVLLADAYLLGGLYFHYDPEKEWGRMFQRVIQDIRDFYQQNPALVSASPRHLFGKESSAAGQVEYLFDRRITIRYDWSNFWSSFFHNSFVYFDLIQFVRWKQHPEPMDGMEVISRQQELSETILRVIAAAAFADGPVSAEQKEVFNYFLQSATLPASRKRQASGYIQKGIQLDELRFDDSGGRLMRRYLLELAVLTIWAHRRDNITLGEGRFLVGLTRKLELSHSELHAGRRSVEAFVVQYWNQVHYLQVKQNYWIVSERLIRRLRQLVVKNQRMIALEVQESKELVYLLGKSTRQELTAVEKEKVRAQLLDILRTIPAFTLFMLPGAMITLPVLFRIIPKHVLYPSSFLPPKEEDDDEEPEAA